MKTKDLAKLKSPLASGHQTCAGCGIPILARTILKTVGEPVIVVGATSCFEVTTTIYPNTAWECPYIHSAFENSAATAAGIDSAIKFLKKTNQMPDKEPTIVVFAGDGGTYDIGLQSLSGVIERGHNFLYICYDNQAYMNTGVQRSSATPLGAWTTTSEVGAKQLGNIFHRKNLTRIVAAHEVPYAAQASISHLEDLSKKVEKALAHPGPKFINVLQPCNVGWKYEPSQTVAIARLAVATRFWPLYEVEWGRTTITVPIDTPQPVVKFLKTQGRFRHLFEPTEQTVLLTEIQTAVDDEWQRLAARQPGSKSAGQHGG